MSARGFDYRAVPRLIRPHLFGSRRVLVAAVLLSVFSAFAELAVPYAVVQLLVHLVVGEAGMTVGPAVTVAAVGVVLTYATYGAGTALAHRVAFDVIARIRGALGEGWSRADPAEISDGHTADARSAASEEVERLEGIIAHGVPETAAGVTVWLVMTGWMVGQDWRLALACAVVAPLALLTMRRAMRANEHRMGEFVAANAAMGRAMLDQLTALAEIRVFGARSPASRAERAIRHTADLQSAWGAAFLRWGAWFSPLVAATPAVVLVLGAWLLAADRLAVETFLLFVVLAPAYTTPLVTLFYRVHSLPLAAAGARAVLGQLDLAEGQRDRRRRDRVPVVGAVDVDPVASGEAVVDVDGVRCARPGRGEVLRGVSFRVPDGATLAVVGESGAGKTTLVELLAGLRRPDEGTVTLGGVPTVDLLGSSGPAGSHRQASVAYAAQTPHLFAGTVGENLRVGRPDAPDHLLHRALDAVGLRGALGPEVLDRRLGEAGAGLSGGQRQRLALARALIVDAGLVLLDEPTASIDPLAERALWEGISWWCRERTVVMATHRIALAGDADLVVALGGDGGMETGAPRDLAGERLGGDSLVNGSGDAAASGVYAGLVAAEHRAGRAVR